MVLILNIKINVYINLPKAVQNENSKAIIRGRGAGMRMEIGIK